MPVASLVQLMSLVTGLLNETPQAIQAWNDIKAMVESGTDPTPEQWAAMIGEIDTANAAVQNAQPIATAQPAPAMETQTGNV